MSELTKEWLLKTIAELEEERDAVPGVVNEDAANALAAMKLALASLEAEKDAEPVAKVDTVGVCWYADNGVPRKPAVGTELYTAPPAPVSVPAAMEMDDDFDSAFEHGKAVGWNACRAAMLQGAEPVTTANKLPANTPCKEAPEHIWLQTAGVWPENGEFSELTWCSDNQHTDDTLYVRADVVTGNSPVIPDGWVMVPEEPTHEMLEAGDEQFGTYDVYRRMIAAAPQQEVTS